jgi:hypothetical protein
MSERTGKLTFDISLGIIVRGQGIFQIKNYCRDAGVEIDINENKGFFSSQYHIIITGTESQLIQAKSDIEKWINANSTK